MSESRDITEVLDLAFFVHEELASAEQISRLELLCLQSPAATDAYLTFSRIRGGIYRRSGSGFAFKVGENLQLADDPQLETTAPKPCDPKNVQQGELPHTTSTGVPPALLSVLGSKQNPFFLAGCTALVAICVYGSFMLIALNLRPDKVPNQLTAGDSECVAVVHETAGVQWSKETVAKLAASPIVPGEPLKIESGTIELQLSAGTKLIVEGPADWSVDSRNTVSLRAGKLVAQVPQQAIGFTVDTPTAKVVDLGTEFGVDVNEQGTAVHVFEGRVVAEFAEEKSQRSRRIELKSSEAARFDVGAASVSKLIAAPEQFQRTKSPTKTAAKKANSLQPDDLKGLQLWLKADAGVFSTFSDDGNDTNDTPAEPGQSVQGWRDFSGHNRHSLQPTSEHRPKLELNVRQRPILRFEGDHWLERSGLVLNHSDPSNFTIIAAFEVSALPDDALNSGSALMALFGQFSSAGDTSRYFGITSQGCLFHAEYRGDPNTVFFGQGRAIVPQRAQIGVLIREGGPRALYAIAPGEGEIVTRSETSENYIGATPILWRVGARWHPQTHEMFRGEIAEMLIYDRALGKSEQRYIEQYLANKFFAEGKTLGR